MSEYAAEGEGYEGEGYDEGSYQEGEEAYEEGYEGEYYEEGEEEYYERDDSYFEEEGYNIVQCGRARALYDYEAADDSEISFAVGDFIQITGASDKDGWLMGERDGASGRVPGNYIQYVSEVETRGRGRTSEADDPRKEKRKKLMEERRVLRAKVEGMAENRRDLDAQVKALEKELANRQQAVGVLRKPVSFDDFLMDLIKITISLDNMDEKQTQYQAISQLLIEELRNVQNLLSKEVKDGNLLEKPKIELIECITALLSAYDEAGSDMRKLTAETRTFRSELDQLRRNF